MLTFSKHQLDENIKKKHFFALIILLKLMHYVFRN